MGNYVSRNCSCACIAAWPPGGAATECKQKQLEKTIMVVHPAEERVVEMGDGAPMTVAELMLEFPGHFAVACETDNPATPLHVSRAIPLPADHEASPGRIYILLPMHRLHARVSPHENASYMALLASSIHHQLHPAAQNFPKKTSLHSLFHPSSAKVTPLSASNSQEKQDKQKAAPRWPSDNDANCQSDDEIDLLLQEFCSARSDGRLFSSQNCSLVRSKSWVPRLQTIDESSMLVV